MSEVQAWIVGVHALPEEFYGMPYKPGEVIVQEDDEVTIMTQEEFERDYQWEV